METSGTWSVAGGKALTVSRRGFFATLTVAFSARWLPAQLRRATPPVMGIDEFSICYIRPAVLALAAKAERDYMEWTARTFGAKIGDTIMVKRPARFGV